MWTAVVTTSPAATEPMTVDAAKAHLRVDGSDEDTGIAEMIAAARSYVEALTCTRLVTQTVALRCDNWSDLAFFPVGPLQAVSAITYVDVNGDTQTLSTDVYEVRAYGLEAGIFLSSGEVWPPMQAGSLITVSAVIGYGAASSIPAPIIIAMKMMISDMFEIRGSFESGVGSAPVPATALALLENHKKYLVT
jgi:uncharacterized phiE125 gp8 family phage protein